MQPMKPSPAAVPTSAERTPEEDGDAAGGSVDLPLDIIEKILHCFSPLESARLAIVCKSWAAIVSARLASLLVPHLFVTETVPRLPGPHARDFYLRGYMVSVPLDGSAGLPSPEIIPAPNQLQDLITRCGAKLIGATPGGRLALAMSRQVIFINPVTGASKTKLVVVSASGCTGLAGDGGDTVLSHGNEYYTSYDGTYYVRTTLYWRERGSEEWSSESVTNASYHDISSLVNLCGVVYVLYWGGSIAKININTGPPLVMEDLNYSRPWRREDDDPCASRDYLLESDREVLFVRQLLAQNPNMCPADYHMLYHTVGFEVHRLDEIGRRWVKVEMLDGDQALFVSARSSFSMSTSDTAGCRSNCIYFVGEGHHVGSCREREDCISTWGIFSMEQGKVLFEHAVVVMERRTVAQWFRPNVVWASHERA